MKAIILAAGRGSRMKGLTDDRPKCLVELNGISLLDRQLQAIRNAGINDIGIVTGYRHELLSGKGLTEFHNLRWAETNMVSSLECASGWLTSEPCVVSYSDIFYEPEAVKLLMESTASLGITYDPNWLRLWERRFGDPLLDAETFRVDSNGFLQEIGNKPRSVDEVQGQYMGLLRFTPESWQKVGELRKSMSDTDRDNMHMTGTLQKMIDAHATSIYAIPYFGVWGEVDSTEDLASYT